MKYPRLRFVGVISLSLVLSLNALSQAPRIISYQGVLTDTNGVAKPNGNYTFTFQFYSAASGGTTLWTEVKSLTVKGGLFATMLGDQSSFPDSLKFDRPYWLNIQVGTEVLSPRIRLGTVGYAFYAFRSDTAKYAFVTTRADTAYLALHSLFSDNSIVGSALADAAVTSSKLADNSVSSTKIIDGTITSSDVSPSFKAPKADTATFALSAGIAGNSIGTSLLQDAAVTDAKLANDAVTASKIKDGEVSTLKLSDNSVTSAKILDGTITSADVTASFKAPKADTASVALTALTAGPSGAAGGDLTGNFPNPSIASAAVTTTKIADGAVTDVKVASVDAAKLSTGTLDDARLSATITKQGNSFNGSNQLVRLTGTGALPALDGSALTNINAGSLAGGTYSNAYTFSSTSNSFTGNGSGLTSLNATNLSSGTVDDARLSTNVTKGGNTFNGANQLLQLTSLGKLPALDGSSLTNVSAGSLAGGTYGNQYAFTNTSNSFAGSFSGDGSALTNLNSANLAAVVPVSKGGTGSDTVNFVNLTNSQTIAVQKVFAPNSNITGLIVRRTSSIAELVADPFKVTSADGSTDYFRVTYNGYLVGDGLFLTNLSASNLALGTIPDARLSGTYNSILAFSNSSNAFAGDGSSLTNLNASNVASGTLNDARLSSNIVRQDMANTFTIGNQLVKTGVSSLKGLIVRGEASQTANLMEWQDNTGGVLASVGADGFLTATSLYSNSLVSNSLDRPTGGTLSIGATGATAVTITPSTTVSGALTASGGVLSNSLDRATAGALSIGSTTATSVTIAPNTTITGDLTANALQTATGQKFKLISGKDTVNVSNLTGIAGITSSTKSFGYTFTSAPIVIITNTSSTGSSLDKLMVGVDSKSTASFTVRVNNLVTALTASGSISFDWIAIGN